MSPPPPKPPLDIAKLAEELGPLRELSFTQKSPEHLEELRHRLAMEAEKQKHDRRIELWIAGVLLFLTVALAALAAGLSLVGDADQKKTGATILTSLLSAGLGFLLGRVKPK